MRRGFWRRPGGSRSRACGRPADSVAAAIEGVGTRPRRDTRSRRSQTRVSFIGSPATVHEQMREFVDRTKADELIIVSHIYDHAARLHSYDIARNWATEDTEFTEKTVR